MPLPYRVMRLLSGSMGANAGVTIRTQLKAIETRARRRLEAGVNADVEADYQALIEGCIVAFKLIDEMPAIIHRYQTIADGIAYDETAADGTNVG